MAAKLIVLVAALAVCQAVPVWIGNYPQVYIRDGRSPSVAFGFGSGFATDIGGIKQATSYGTSFQSGDGEAYGSGLASADGRTFARGTGVANVPHVRYPVSNHQLVSNNFNRNNYGSAISSAQNHGNFGSALSAAQSHNGFGSAISNANNRGLGGHQTALSSAQNFNGVGHQSAVASANSNGWGQGSAISAAQGFNGNNNFGTAVAAAQNFGNYQASTAQAIQQRGSLLRESGATSINAPGIQAANAHAINTGYSYY
ncbi:unnamed protein product [Parnassius apollo]|uniref:(apollo) hypothetical protein n=1 Tax=Parnassius apollo TaxID=110799 RepID=A0A8S3WW54_PARAO|nr:unnamed protein product [Parnassius apollo]